MTDLVQGNSTQKENIREKTLLSLDLKGRYLKPSLREMFIVDEYLKSFAYEPVARAYAMRFGKTITGGTIARWIRRGGAEGYLNLRMSEQGQLNRYRGEQGKALWLRELLEFRDGVRECGKNTVKLHELIGQVMGYMDSASAAGGDSMFRNIKNMQINFTQANGEA